jgi:hypothetical protein
MTNASFALSVGNWGWQTPSFASNFSMQAFDLEEPTGDELLTGTGRKSAAGGGGDAWAGGRSSGGGHSQQRRLLLLGLVGLLSLLLSIAALGASSVAASRSRSAGTSATPPASWGHIRRIAFGSCSSYDIRPQPIWTEVSGALGGVVGLAAAPS